MFIYVGGISGVGKTTIIRWTIELAKRINFSLQGLEEKKMLCQIAGVSSAEEYAKLPAETRAETRRRMVDHFYKVDEQDLTSIRIRDDHFTAPNKDGTYWVRPLEARDTLHMLAFVVIVGEPDDILRRRLNRELLSPEPNFLNLDEIIRHQEMEVGVAFLQAKHLNIPFKVVENEEEKIIQTSEMLLCFIKEVAEWRLSNRS